jgi:hypothetical protein
MARLISLDGYVEDKQGKRARTRVERRFKSGVVHLRDRVSV